MARRFKAVAIGGTFDKLHKGHKALLRKAFEVGEHVLIGLTSDMFVKSMNKTHPTESYAHRLEELEAFLQKNSYANRAQVVPLDDAFGPASTSDSIEALVVSTETIAAATKLNSERLHAGLRPLETVVVNLIHDECDLPISTTRIRHGEVDSEGHLLRKCSK